jgi:uncharacterized protein YlbG (UPF0298 family)
MYANRMQYIIFYQGKQIIEKLKTLPIDVSYISEKSGYVVFYGDKDLEAQLKKQLKDVKGFKHIGTSQTYDENLNF